jgi:hypothetical protein
LEETILKTLHISWLLLGIVLVWPVAAAPTWGSRTDGLQFLHVWGDTDHFTALASKGKDLFLVTEGGMAGPFESWTLMAAAGTTGKPLLELRTKSGDRFLCAGSERLGPYPELSADSQRDRAAPGTIVSAKRPDGQYDVILYRDGVLANLGAFPLAGKYAMALRASPIFTRTPSTACWSARPFAAA